jgi:hypothetical protein
MTTPHTPLLPPSTADEAVLAEADALLSPQRMGNRARLLLARSSQLQALHGQALQAVRAQPGALPPALAGSSVQDLLTQSAAQAVAGTHHQLAAAAAQAHQLAAADPLLARLQAAIDGRPAPPQVVDVQATELPPSRAGTAQITDVSDATPAPSPRQADAPPAG